MIWNIEHEFINLINSPDRMCFRCQVTRKQKTDSCTAQDPIIIDFANDDFISLGETQGKNRGSIGLLTRKVKTLFRHPKTVFFKYTKRTYFKIISAPRPYLDEDYNHHWGFTDFKGKTILDLGADYGSTAWFFLEKGAKSVVAVEGDPYRAKKLATNSAKYGFTSFEKTISSIKDIERFIENYKFDVAKVDIEGAEIYLLSCRSDLLKKIPLWMIESHSDQLTSSVSKLFKELNFKVKQIQKLDEPTIIIARKFQ